MTIFTNKQVKLAKTATLSREAASVNRLRRFQVNDGGIMPGDGIQDDALFLSAALALSPNIKLDHGKTFYCKTQIVMPDDSSIIGDGSQTFVMDISTFTNSNRNNYRTSAANLFLLDGVSNARLEKFKIVPSVQDGGRVRLPIVSLTDPGAGNIVVGYSGLDVLANGQGVVLYGMTGASEVNADTLAGVANGAVYTVANLNTGAKTFELSGTSGVAMTAWTSGGYIEPSRFVAPIALSQADNCVIDNIDIHGFTVGYATALDSSTNITVIPHVHDWYTNYIFADGSAAQQTGVEIDQDRIGGVGSSRIRVVGGSVVNLDRGLAASYQQDQPTLARRQSDGAHPGGQAASGKTPTRDVEISGNYFDGVDDGVDNYGKSCIVANNRFKDIGSYAVKVIYGASNMVISGNTFGLSGRSTITINASPTALALDDTNTILIIGNVFEGISDYYSALASEFGCVIVEDNGPSTAWRATNKIVSTGNIYNAGTYGDWCINYAALNATSEFLSTGDTFAVAGTMGYINRSRYRQIGIAAVSIANPGVVTMLDLSDFALITSGVTIYIRGAEGMTQLVDDYYKIGSNPAGGSFTLQTAAGVDIDTSAWSAYSGGATLQVGSKIEVTNPTGKTICKAVLIANQTIALGVNLATLEFKAAMFDMRREVVAASNGIVVQLPGHYLIEASARTTGSTPSSATEETIIKVLVTGSGQPLVAYYAPRDNEPITYRVSGVVWCDAGDIITATLTFINNANGVTISREHGFTFLSAVMI